MASVSDETRRSYANIGLRPMKAADGLAALASALSGPEPQSVIADIDWQKLRPVLEMRISRPLLSELGGRTDAPAVAAAAAPVGPNLPARLAQSSDHLRQEILVDFVRRAVGETLGSEGEELDVDLGLFDLGMDSLMSVKLKSRLELGSGLALPSTLTFNYPSIRALVGYFEKTMGGTGAEDAPAAVVVETPQSDLDRLSDDDIEARLLAQLEQLK